MKTTLKSLLILSFIPALTFAQTITEKKNELAQKEDFSSQESIDSALRKVNTTLAAKKKQLTELYTKATVEEIEKLSEQQRIQLLEQINSLKAEIISSETAFQEKATAYAKEDLDGYGFWDLEEVTLSQLVMEYGSMDYLYVIPPEISSLKLHVHSALPIPRESWNEVLEIILLQNGVGVKKLSPSVRQLFVLKQNLSAVHSIICGEDQLRFAPDHERLFYLLSLPLDQTKGVLQFFERFAEPKQTFVYQIGSKIALVSSKEEIIKLLGIYKAIWEGQEGRISKVVPVVKMSVKEMEKILISFFGEQTDKTRAFFGKAQQEKLSIFPLDKGGALVIVGQKELVEEAERVVQEMEKQLQDPSEMAVFFYTCRHSDPADLAHMLEKVYLSMLTMKPEQSTSIDYSASQTPVQVTQEGATVAPLPVAPPSIESGQTAHLEIDRGTTHFISDPKTGGLLMVIRRDMYPRLKELVKRLDVPKKMVQIEVLLFEKQLAKQSSFGMNLLKLGTPGKSSVSYSGSFAPSGLGVLEFFFKGDTTKQGPAFNLAYNFLMTQDDVQLNAAPSVLTVNQTPATVSIVEEISINNGASGVNSSKSGVIFEKSFSRAQYGITIVLTPTIHLSFDEDDLNENDGFITLQTNITFDTTKNSSDDRPLVDRRHLKNEVRVHDGQTIILGGLRRKSSQERRDKVPFLGDLPGVGKLFGSTTLINNNTEMFFFITPTIILDPKTDLERIRMEQLKKRPGDIPEFLLHLEEARKIEKAKQIDKSLKQIAS